MDRLIILIFEWIQFYLDAKSSIRVKHKLRLNFKSISTIKIIYNGYVIDKHVYILFLLRAKIR